MVTGVGLTLMTERRMEQRGLGRRSVSCWKHQNGKLDKPSARLGDVGGNRWGLNVSVFVAQRLPCVCVCVCAWASFHCPWSGERLSYPHTRV